MQKRKKVFVGLSGGVDSSVSAALLKEAGFDVVGVFIKVWQPDFLPCTWQEERRDAMRVAARLAIPFLTFDFEAEYKRDVVDYLLADYAAGRTPNPDVMCNHSIKFGAFLEKALSLGADAIATGHYARIEERNGKHALFAGKDTEKDQSYFLWTLKQEDLSRVFFPVGGMEKRDVRKLAKKFGLPTATKKDSQGLCFMGKLDMQEFLTHFIQPERGVVLSVGGEPIGHHAGAALYTIGERHGFSLTTPSPLQKRQYVVGKDVATNTITVSPDPLADSAAFGVRLGNLHWIRNTPKAKQPLRARFRYRQALFDVSIEDAAAGRIRFTEAQSALALGQSLVLYDGEECLGGGSIEEVYYSA